MNEKELIRRCMKAKGVTQEELAKMFGYKSQGTISTMLNPKTSMRVDVLTRFFDLLGFDLLVVDKETGEKIGRVTTKVREPKKIDWKHGWKSRDKGVGKKADEVPVEESKEKEVSEEKSVEIPTFQYGRKW